MAATVPLRETLNQGISSGRLIDTKIVLYSHRDSSGRIYRPKALYTNSRILKTLPYFNDLLFGNFAESRSRSFREELDEDDCADGYGYLSDSDIEDDEDEKLPSVRYRIKPGAHSSGPFGIPGEDTISYEEYEENIEEGKVVRIPDIAFVTFQAFLVYLYTNVIEFAPFGSEENRRSRRAELVKPTDDKVPRPSPKSIYRLADKYDLPALKTLALNHMRGELAKCDIVEESFSRFASQYDEVRNLYLDQLAVAWMDCATKETTRARVEEKIDSFSEGDLEHATEILSTLWEIASKDGDVQAPSNTTPAATPPASPAHWASVHTALIKSIRTGVFFDRKYWTRYSKTGELVKPVYFSSIIMNDKGQQINKLVKYFKGRDPLMKDLERDANVESDCELMEPAVPFIAPREVNPTPFSKKSKKKGPQPPQSQSSSKPTRGWDKMFLDVTDPQTPYTPPPVAEPAPTLWGRPAPVSPISNQQQPQERLASLYGLLQIPPQPVKEESKPVDAPKSAEKDPIGVPEKVPGTSLLPGHQEPANPSKEPAQEKHSLGTTDELPKPEEEAQTRALLVTGSFSAWKSLFFYRCTDEIFFAPLRSQGAASRSNFIREKTVATKPLPCSPKSIYVLAGLLGIQPLREKALEDIKKNVNANNVVGEVFSWVTAGQKELLEMESDLMVSNFKGPRTNTLVKENISHMSDGTASHYAGALKLGLEKAFDRKILSFRVKLRCSHGNCTWYSNHVAYSSIGSGVVYCQLCTTQGRGNRYLQCAGSGCGYNRTGVYTSCQSCQKGFA